MKFKRKWKCCICGKPLIYDEERSTLTCDCGVATCHSVDFDHYDRIEKVIA